MGLSVEDIVLSALDMMGNEQNDAALNNASQFDPTTANGKLLLRSLNMGMKRLASWRSAQTGRRFRHRYFVANVVESVAEVETGLTVTAATSTTAITAATISSPPTVANQYQDYLVRLTDAADDSTSDSRVLTSTAAAACALTVSPAFSFTPATSDEVTLRPRWLTLTKPDDYMDILNVYDAETQRRLTPMDNAVMQTTLTMGDPSMYQRVGERVYFDRVPDSDRSFLLEVYRNPKALVASDATAPTAYSYDTVTAGTRVEPDFPEPYRYVLVLWLCQWLAARQMNFEVRNQYYQELETFMVQSQTEDDIRWMKAERPGATIETDRG